MAPKRNSVEPPQLRIRRLTALKRLTAGLTNTVKAVKAVNGITVTASDRDSPINPINTVNTVNTVNGSQTNYEIKIGRL